MTKRERMKMRAKAKAKALTQADTAGDGSFGAGIRLPEEPTPVLDKVKLADQYLRDKAEEEGMVGYGGFIPQEGAIPFATGGIVGGLTKNAPLTALAVTGSQALDRWLHDQQNTPEKISDDMKLSLLLEGLPAVMAPVVRSMIKSGGYARSLFLKAANLPPDAKKEIKDAVVRVSKQFGSNKGGIKEVDKMTEALTKEVDDVIKKLDNQGVKVDTGKLVDKAENELLGSMDNRALNADDLKSASGSMGKQRKQWGATSPTESPILDAQGQSRVIPGQPPKPIGIEEANQFKRNTYNNISKAYEAATKQGNSVSDRAINANKAALAKATKEAIEDADVTGTIGSKNKDISDLLTWRNHMAKNLEKKAMAPSVPRDVYVPLIIESMIRGGPGIGTALGVTKTLFNSPTLLGKSARIMSMLEDTSYIPGSNSMISQLIRDWQGEGLTIPESESFGTSEAWSRKGSVK